MNDPSRYQRPTTEAETTYERNLRTALEIAKHAERLERERADRAWNVVDRIRLARSRETRAIQLMVTALHSAIPLLTRLGDFIGNGEGPTGNERCETILKVREALRQIEDTLT